MNRFIAIREIRFNVLKTERIIVRFLCVVRWEFNIVQNHDCQEKKKRDRILLIRDRIGVRWTNDLISDTTDEEKRSTELMKRAKYGIFGPISSKDRQPYGTDESKRVRICKIDLGTEASTTEARVADYFRLCSDLRHRRVRQRGHLHCHQAKSRHANRY